MVAVSRKSVNKSVDRLVHRPLRRPLLRGRGRGNPSTLRPFRPGPDPRRGHGPPKGSGGRPRLEHRAWLASLEPQARANMENFLRRAPAELRYRATVDVLDRLYGKAVQPTGFANLGDLIALACEGATGEVEGES